MLLPSSPGPIDLAADVDDLDRTAAVVAVTGKTKGLSRLGEFNNAERVHAYNLNQSTFDQVCGLVSPALLYLYNWPVLNIAALGAQTGLSSLVLEWNPKVVDLGTLSDLPNIRQLALRDLKRVRDLTPIKALTRLEALELAGGVWSPLQLDSLAPISALTRLRSLKISNVKVADETLEPLASLKSLDSLIITNQFPTSEFARLSVALPNVRCDMLAPFVEIEIPIGGNDVMVVGKGKPLLNSRRDAAKLAGYVDAFRGLQDEYGI